MTGWYSVMTRHTDRQLANYDRRKDRLFREGFGWFYHIRDARRGPFVSEEAARQDLTEYLATVRFIEENPGSLPADLDADEITHIEIGPPPY